LPTARRLGYTTRLRLCPRIRRAGPKLPLRQSP